MSEAGDENGKPYQRTGEVRAVRMSRDWTWQTARGEPMRGESGDWLVSDASGPAWSVADRVFHSTFRHIEGERWERIGTVRARLSESQERVRTLEGDVVAHGGDWIVTGPGGDRWVVRDQDFVRRYRAVAGT
jgi:hypothetical protein